ncbi:efflux RND transporter periplasmic adaptor subunit [Puteibacter caeruleilacunae]|nr:efflux RND transporter periplasmic adaptor subunit [Puteibacter caeruleilacunae]
MKQIAYIIIAVFLMACGNTTKETADDKKERLVEYKTQLKELKDKIAELEEELGRNDATEEIVSVATIQLSKEKFEHFVEVTGTVEADLDINVSPEAAGEIISIDVKEGDWVKKGQIIARLNTETVARSIDEIKINLALAQTTFERQSRLWKQKIGSEIEYLQAKANKEALEMKLQSLEAQLDMATVKSPIDGVLDIIYQKKGEIASAQVPFAKVMNINKVKIYGDLAEGYITKIRKGDDVQVFFPALNRTVTAKIERLGNEIDSKNRTFKVRINIANKDNLIKPNMISVLQFRDYLAEDVITLPALLIREDFKGSYVFVVKKEGNKHIARKAYIKTGMTNNNITEIVEGLDEGTMVISEGLNMISEGTQVKI